MAVAGQGSQWYRTEPPGRPRGLRMQGLGMAQSKWQGGKDANSPAQSARPTPSPHGLAPTCPGKKSQSVTVSTEQGPRLWGGVRHLFLEPLCEAMSDGVWPDQDRAPPVGITLEVPHQVSTTQNTQSQPECGFWIMCALAVPLWHPDPQSPFPKATSSPWGQPYIGQHHSSW